MYMVLANPTQYVSSFTHHITPTLLHRIASHPHCRIYTTPTPPHHTASHPLRSTASHHIKSHHITSHHITSQRIASHHITLSLPHLYHSRSTTPHCISPIILAHPRCHIASLPHTRLNTIPAPPQHNRISPTSAPHPSAPNPSAPHPPAPNLSAPNPSSPNPDPRCSTDDKLGWPLPTRQGRSMKTTRCVSMYICGVFKLRMSPLTIEYHPYRLPAK